MDYFHNINVVNTQYDRILISADQCIWHILPWKWVFFSQVYLWLWAYLRKFLRNTHFLTFCHSIYCLQNFISSDSQWLAKLVLAVQLSLKSAHNFRPEKTFCRRWVVNCGRNVVSWLLHSSLDNQEVWVQALAGDIAVFWDTILYSHSASPSTQVYK